MTNAPLDFWSGVIKPTPVGSSDQINPIRRRNTHIYYMIIENKKNINNFLQVISIRLVLCFELHQLF